MWTLALVGLLVLPQNPQDLPKPNTTFVEGYLAQAHDHASKGELDAALASVQRALERDDRYLPALRLQAEIAERKDDKDTAVHSLHRWIDVAKAQKKAATVQESSEVLEHLLELDPEAKVWDRLQDEYVRNLLDIGKAYQRRKDWLGSLDLYRHVIQVEPEHDGARGAIDNIRRTGGSSVAIEDVYAGGDPTAGMSTEQIEKMDKAHLDWKNAYKDDSDNYAYRTNAGFLVLKTSAIAMEQMNGFYRKFFHFKEDGGKTPKIEIRIFKSRDEYLDLGASPVKWSAGHFIGSAVETYVGGVSGKESIRDMYRTLFHEAAHHFVSMTGPLVPGWLNEAYASFFEGCVIMSNGSVKWNEVPPHRLFPLASRLEKGFMSAADEAREDANGEWQTPETAPPFGMVITGRYQWGPPWYAPTWGVVYFLYNYRDEHGRPVYRDGLHAYYESFKRGQPQDPIAHFEETVLQPAKLSKIRTVAELNDVWKAWILRLRDRLTGAEKQGDELIRFADAALERGEKDVALEFLEEQRDRTPEAPELLWKIAGLLEQVKKPAEAAARYREFKRVMELSGNVEDERLKKAAAKIDQLDPLSRRYLATKSLLAEKGLQLARSYEERGFPTMALEIARRMSGSFSIPEALEYYAELAERTGKSLARWRVAYNERDLQGWSGEAESYQAYGAMIRAGVKDDGSGQMMTNQLTADVTFDADFSLEAEMRIEGDSDGGFKGRLMGLCFGQKGAQDYHAVMLHPKGFMDIATNAGGVWTIHDHRSVGVGGDWHTLRIDVTGNNLDVYLDGLYARSLDFVNPGVVRGAFGLICGPGEAAFRNIRLLGRDPFDPAARIERELAMKRVREDASQRQAGTFAGFVPPEIEDADWRQGEPTTLAGLRGKPVLLAFWSPRADAVIPCTQFIEHLAERGTAAGLETIVLCSSGTTAEALDAYLQEHPMAKARIGIDANGTIFDAYFVKAGFHGLPRVLLIDGEGKVTFEGDPGLTSGRGWQPGDEPTFVEAAFRKLIGGE